MTAEEVMNMCESGECSVVYGDMLLMRTRDGIVYVSLDGHEWNQTEEDMFKKLFE